jgi:hypothetical protein
VHPSTAAPSLARQSPPPSTPSLEALVGQITASAAAAIARALRERENGRLDPRTKAQGGDLIAMLFGLQQATAGKIDFYAVARARGAQTLAERYGDAVDARTIDILIDGAIEVLQKVVRAQMN